VKFKRGFIRSDGLMFWSLRSGKEIWLTKEKFERRRLLKNEWQRKNIDANKNRENVRNWLKNNLHKKMSYVRSYQARKMNSKVKCNNLKVVSVFYDAAKRIGNCMGIKFSVDHIIPLSKGGSHSPENLQWVPFRWNSSKGNRFPGKRWAIA
jgi:5-methylcytosine-specific restriction endonuclease McrA